MLKIFDADPPPSRACATRFPGRPFSSSIALHAPFIVDEWSERLADRDRRLSHDMLWR